MKRAILRYLVVVMLLTAVQEAFGQRPAGRRDRNKADIETVSRESLEEQRDQLALEERALRESLESARNVYASNPSNRETIGKRIVELEGKINELNTRIEALDAEIESLPQDDFHGHGQSGQSATVRKTSDHAVLTDNEYFRRNLPVEEYRLLVSAQEQEKVVEDMIRQLKSDYDLLTELVSEYGTLPKGEQANELYSEINRLSAANTRLASQTEDLWNRIYETKSYSYIYLLDRGNHYDLIAELERQMNDLVMREREMSGKYMYDQAVRYALGKKLITECEIRIAEREELRAAKDSLSRVANRLKRTSEYFMPVIDTRERMFYDYADAVPVKPARYTNSSQIPDVEIFSRGDMYRILTGSYAKIPAITVFKGLYPLAHELKQDNKHYYYAGGYATYEAAQTACERLKKSGFANAKTVAWHDGRYDSDPQPNKDAGFKSQQFYRIEISCSSSGLSSTARNIITNRAAGKEVSRMIDHHGQTVFSVSSFNSRELAESLRDDLLAAEPALIINISAVD